MPTAFFFPWERYQPLFFFKVAVPAAFSQGSDVSRFFFFREVLSVVFEETPAKLKLSSFVSARALAFSYVAMAKLKDEVAATQETQDTQEERETLPAPEVTEALVAVPSVPPGGNAPEETGEPEQSQQTVPASPAQSGAEDTQLAQPQGVEGMGWKELDLQSSGTTAYCTSCGLVAQETTLVKEAVRRKGHQRLRCVHCQCVTNMLYKRMDMAAIGFKDMPEDQVKKFFQEAGKMKTSSGQLEWRKIRGLLEESMASSEIRRQTTSLQGKFHPLSVWASKGYDCAMIEQKAESRPSDLLPDSDSL